MHTTFGAFVKERRLARRITLRAFSQSLGFDPANYSRIERGLAQPPTAEERLRAMARLLGMEEDSEDYREMRRLADLGRGQIPRAVLSDAEVAAKLPLLFRTLEGEKVDEAMLDELYEAMRRE